jgi:hypothetical protein
MERIHGKAGLLGQSELPDNQGNQSLNDYLENLINKTVQDIDMFVVRYGMKPFGLRLYFLGQVPNRSLR